MENLKENVAPCIPFCSAWFEYACCVKVLRVMIFSEKHPHAFTFGGVKLSIQFPGWAVLVCDRNDNWNEEEELK